MSILHDLVIDAAHPASLARFWAAALDGYEIAPYDDAEIARLAANGIFDIEDDPSVLLVREDGGEPRVIIQLVPEGKAAKNRVHLDLRSADHDAELARLGGLGARVLEDYAGHTTLADPEGNEFCLIRPS
ncbi:glyoxalase [Actinorhabdospora filicis]|uniref:Glyoxalase n=1 Tax=Actinorhabdospora filicis TaxID=1785913 RepID=A0A9W6W8N3_9ACTN|nr:VOC family protein [Actinorhabdospora filicis]GLZ77153.1 glyoxalase [Actinorhabdospora filicis]